MNTYLLAIHIGPVQDFIAAARKLRDLWFGSYLLSELSKQAARSLQQSGADLIFPNPTDADEELAKGSAMKAPNKLLVRIETDDPRCVFKKAKESLLSFWKKELVPETIERAWDKINKELFWLQVEDFLEIYGAWVPVKNGNYCDARQRVDSLLAARKSLREFSPARHLKEWHNKGGLPKSSLDGGRESVLLPEFRGEAKQKGGIKKYEELDAVGWVKRYGKKFGQKDRGRPAFDSLSDLAGDPFLRGALKNPNAWRELEKLAELFRQYFPEEHIPNIVPRYPGSALDNLGASILFLSRTRIALEEIEKPEDDQRTKQDILGCIRLVHDIMETEPLQYAAVLIGDGDDMGRAISSLAGQQDHNAFSRALDEFARTAGSEVEKRRGTLIYSGGDDVLAFVPLDYALECAQALQKVFASTLGKVFPHEANRPTFSIGMAIVHHIRPMGLSLETARKAEKLAKTNPGKNSLAIILEKRSGSPIHINQQWKLGFVERLLYWVDCHRADLLPDKLAYQLKFLAKELGDELKWRGIEPENPQAYEFLRILKRKRSQRGSKPLEEEQGVRVMQAASTLNSLDNLANELIIARIFAQAKDQAKLKEDIE